MMIRVLVLLTKNSLRRQPARSLMAVLAVAAGVSLAVGVFAAKQSASRSVLSFNAGFAGDATLRVASSASHGGLPDDVADRIARVPGVGAAVPVIHTAVAAVDSRGNESVVAAFGLDCRVAALSDAITCSPDGSDSLGSFTGVAMSRRLYAELGPNGAIRTDLGRVQTDRALVLKQLDDLNGGRVVVFSLARAHDLFARPGSVDSVFVVPDGSVPDDRLRVAVHAAAGKWTEIAAADSGFRGSDSFVPITAGLTLVGILGLAVGGQLVFNTISLSLEERRKETATLSALGGRSGAVAAFVLVEAITLGLAGGLLGVIGATVIERRLLGSLGRFVSDISGVHLIVHRASATLVLCVLVGTLVAALAAIRPARRASRLDLAAELTASAHRVEAAQQIRPRRAVGWAAGAGLGLLLSWLGGRDGSLESWQVPVAYLGVALTLPLAARAASLGAPWLLRRFRRAWPPKSGRVAVVFARLVREPGRTAATTLAVTSAIAIAIVLGGMRTGMRATGANLAIADAGQRVALSTQRADNTIFIDSNPSPKLIEAVNRNPAVAETAALKTIEVDHPVGFDFTVNADLGGPGYHVFRGAGRDDAFANNRVMVGPALARQLDVRPGDTITVPGRDSFVDLVVGGIWAMPSNQGFSIDLPVSRLEEIWGPQPAQRLYVTPAPGVTIDHLAQTLRAANLDPDMRVWTPNELAASYANTWDDFLAPFASLQQALIVMAAVAVITTLLLVGVQRQREHGILGALGLTPRGLAELAAAEAFTIAVIGTALGTVAGLVATSAVVNSSAVLSGLTIPFRLNAAAVLTSAGLLVGVVTLAGLLPAWRSSKIDLIDALHYE